MHKIFLDVGQYASTRCHFEGNVKSDVSSHFVIAGNFFRNYKMTNSFARQRDFG